MKQVIHIFGASGSGTTTLGRAICAELGWRFMDSDDYFWLDTDPKYTQKRPNAERLERMNRDLDAAEHAVISGSLVDWGDPLMERFTLAVRLDTPTDVRIPRLRSRERAAFGSRVLPGGDMFDTHEAFIAWAARYDTAGVEMCSRAKHDAWQRKLRCRVLRLDGTQPPLLNVRRVCQALGQTDERER